LYLTPKGREHYAVGIGKRAAFHEALLEDLTQMERTQLDDLLLKIGGRLMKKFRTTGTD
jgi:DNA-binding MarR family transcriptional regulator